ncbi:MAG: GIY-YIG nuclease family protein, partial [bacterium]
MYQSLSCFMTNFHYVYILVDCSTNTHFYVGKTHDLKARLAGHNSGQCPH